MRDFADAKAALEINMKIGANAMEFNDSNIELFDGNISALDSQAVPLDHVSLHGRGGPYRNDDATKRVLEKYLELHKIYTFKCIVIHPRDVEDWTLFKNYNLPFAIENMDNREARGITVAEIKNIVEETGFNVVLDANHCFTIDPTMKLAEDFIEEFGTKVIQVHISGYSDPGIPGRHVPLFKTKQDIIIHAVKKLNLPFIIESSLANKTEARQEFEYIKNILKS